MKKLMIALAAAATTMFSFGDFTSTGFENSPYVAGALLSTTNDDNGLVAGESGFKATWVALPEEEVVEHEIRAYGENDPAPEGGGNQYLHVESSNTSTLLQRNVQPGGAAASIGDGIYLDTLVKFSPADKLFEASDIVTGDKIAITYVGEDATEVENPISNIVVYAGYVSSSDIVATNYVMNLPGNADFDVNAWHRLTVRSIANVGSSAAPVGFAIYIDGNKEPLTYASNVAAGDSAYVESLNAAVQTYLYNGEKHALLPSLVANGGTDFDKLTTVGFKGSGCVDNLAFTADPGFIEEGTAVEIAWDEGVATYTVVDSENNTLVDGAVTGGTAGSTNLLLEVGITYLTVTATYGTGYEAGTWTVTGDGAAISGGTFTVADGAKLNINSMTPKFDVGGDHYGTFAEALDAAVTASTKTDPWTSVTIKMLCKIDEGVSFSTGDIVLDLNGNTLQGTVEEFTINNSGASLTIIDSASGGTVKAPTGDASRGALYMDDGATVINGGQFDGYVITQKMDEGDGADDLTLISGAFYDDMYDPGDDESVFYLKDYLGDGVGEPVFNDETLYFTVGGGEPPAPTTYELTIPTVKGASATVTDKATSSVIADIAAIEDGTVVTVTWTPESGYKITAGASEEITMDADKTAKEPTVVDITYATLTITQVENCTIVVSNATEEVASGAQFDVDDATQLTVYRTPAKGYKLSSGYAATETITMNANVTVTAVVEEEPEYPSYIPEDAAVKAKYDTWATTYGADTGSAYEDAFLLNIAPDAVDQTLEPASITMEGGKVVISANQTLTAVNGKVYVKVATTLAGLATAEWTEATLDEGKVQVTPGSSDTAGFYKIKVDF